MHDKHYPIVNYRYDIPIDITGSTTNMIDPAELQFNSAIVYYVKLPPRDNTDNNGLTTHNNHTDTDYTIVKDYIIHIHTNIYCIHCNYI